LNNKLNIATFNFKDLRGIQNHIDFLKDCFSQNMDISVSTKIDENKNNIFIDDFSKQSAIDYLIKKKTENRELRFSLILTEFFNKNVNTLNGFEFKNKDNFEFLFKTITLFYLIKEKYFNFINSFPLLFYLVYQSIIKLILFIYLVIYPTKIRNWKTLKKVIIDYSEIIPDKISLFFLLITFFLLSPLILILMLSYGFKLNFLTEYLKQSQDFGISQIFSKTKSKIFFSKIKSKISNLIYFKKRYDGLIKVFPYIDIIYYAHPKIRETIDTKIFDISKKIETEIIFFPKNKKIKLLNKKNKIYFSGELTPYRANIFNTFKIKNKNWEEISKNLDNTIYATYFIEDSLNEYSFTLNPKKNEHWNFSSPTRYMRSLNRNEIPIVIDHFNDYTKYLTVFCDLESLILSDLIKKKEEFINKINKNLIKLKILHYKFRSKFLKNYNC
jgi:hypothetical protein